MRAIVPISELARRMPEAGRIRTGEKKGNRPAAIGSFRFTSHDRTALEQIAAMYGGTVRPWSDPKAADGQHEVITDAPEIRVVLPPDPLGGTPIYEMWGGGGCERRCDGVTCGQWQTGPDGPEQVDVACICQARGEMACKPITRLTVILPEVRFAGVWRLDTKSWNAAQELPGMVDTIQLLQATKGLPYATLALRHRRSVVAGKTSKFLVPVLGVAVSVDELAAGAGNIGSLGSGTPTPAPEREALAAEVGDYKVHADAIPDAPPRPPDPDDEIIDAELVDEPAHAAPVDLADAVARASGVTQAKALKAAREIAGRMELPLPGGLDEVTGPVLDELVRTLGIEAPASNRDPRMGKMHVLAAKAWEGSDKATIDARRKGLIGVVTDHRTASSKELEPAEWDDLFSALEQIAGGSMELFLRSNGEYELRAVRR